MVTIGFGIKFYNDLSSGSYAEKKTGYISKDFIDDKIHDDVVPVSDPVSDPVSLSKFKDLNNDDHFFYYRLKNLSSDFLGSEFKTIGNFIIFDDENDNFELTNILASIDQSKFHYYIKVYLVEININKNVSSGFDFIFDSLKNTGNELFIQLISKNTFSFVSDSFNISSFINNSSNNVNVLSEPVLLVKQGFSSVVSAVSDTPVINSVNFDVDTKNQISNYSYKNIGLTLNIDVADFSTSSNCFIHLNQEISYISGYQHIDNNDLPIIASRKINNDVVLKKYETLILSSVRRTVKTSVINSVPILSSIPVFGRLFINKNNIVSSSDLVIMLELVNIQ
ncbi:MAG: hypothetical protein P9L97_01475 [Candidatus Tenebribacter davisii]|nr:hypothetical protein [Candidatus Tenebribacter davisii]